MPEILESNLPALIKLCIKHKLKYLYAIGSVLTDKFMEDSDIDFLFELDRDNISDEDYLPNLDGLISGLLEMFKGRKLDLVDYSALKNPYFIAEVDETKVLLYEQHRTEIPV